MSRAETRLTVYRRPIVTSYEEKQNALGRPERLFMNLIFVDIFNFFEFLKIHYKSCCKIVNAFLSIFGCSKNQHHWFSKCWKLIILGDFEKWSFFHEIYFFLQILSSFMKSLYELSRQWPGWQFTGGPKWVRKYRLPGHRKSDFWNLVFNSFCLRQS